MQSSGKSVVEVCRLAACCLLPAACCLLPATTRQPRQLGALSQYRQIAIMPSSLQLLLLLLLLLLQLLPLPHSRMCKTALTQRHPYRSERQLAGGTVLPKQSVGMLQRTLLRALSPDQPLALVPSGRPAEYANQSRTMNRIYTTHSNTSTDYMHCPVTVVHRSGQPSSMALSWTRISWQVMQSMHSTDMHTGDA